MFLFSGGKRSFLNIVVHLLETTFSAKQTVAHGYIREGTTCGILLVSKY